MADNAFQFSQAPSGKGRQFGAVVAAAKLLGVGKNGGMSARDTSRLMTQQHLQNKDLASHTADLQARNAGIGAIVGHVLGQEAAKSQHSRDKSMSKLNHKQSMEKDYQQRLFTGSEAEANRAHQTKIAGAAYEATNNPDIRSFNANTGSFTTTHPMQVGQQFDGEE